MSAPPCTVSSITRIEKSVVATTALEGRQTTVARRCKPVQPLNRKNDGIQVDPLSVSLRLHPRVLLDLFDDVVVGRHGHSRQTVAQRSQHCVVVAMCPVRKCDRLTCRAAANSRAMPSVRHPLGIAVRLAVAVAGPSPAVPGLVHLDRRQQHRAIERVAGARAETCRSVRQGCRCTIQADCRDERKGRVDRGELMLAYAENVVGPFRPLHGLLQLGRNLAVAAGPLFSARGSRAPRNPTHDATAAKQATRSSGAPREGRRKAPRPRPQRRGTATRSPARATPDTPSRHRRVRSQFRGDASTTRS